MENKDLDINLAELDQVEANADAKLQVKNRFEKLSEKVILTSKERDELAKSKAELEQQKAALEKETNFYKTFSKLSSQYPEAINYQAQILEKVNKGYDEEDATLAVLAHEGKLGNTQQPARTPAVEGGSALTQLSDGDKSVNDLSAAEKLSALQDMEKSGELTQLLRAGINRT